MNSGTIIKYSGAIFILVLAFLCTSWLTYSSPKSYTSPDENINLFFTQLYANTGKLSYTEPLNEITGGYAHPRNSTSRNNVVVPGGFSGFYVILGTFGAVAPFLEHYFTPILSIIGVIFIFLLTRLLFDEKTALIASFLSLTSATYIFWSSRSLFNNILATTLFIGGVTFTFYLIQKKHIVYYILAGLLFGLDAFVRLTDFTFLIPVIIILIIYRSNLKLKYFIAGVFVYIIALMPALLLNKKLYGGFLSSGYADAINTSANQGQITAMFHKIGFFLLPSGFHPLEMFVNVNTYLFFFAPLLFGLALLALVMYRKNLKIWNYGIFFILITLWILTYYGSGKFYGSQSFTMDSSFTRYFLPIYLLVTPLAASLIIKLKDDLAFATLLVVAYFSVHLAFYGQDGLFQMRERRISTNAGAKALIKSTELNSVIFSSLADKYIFPQRTIIAYGPYLDTNNLSKNKIYTENRMATYITNVSKTGRPTYLYNDRNDFNFEMVNKKLNQNDLTLQSNPQVSNLYKVGKL
jgi:hypothetical protein